MLSELGTATALILEKNEESLLLTITRAVTDKKRSQTAWLRGDLGCYCSCQTWGNLLPALITVVFHTVAFTFIKG